MTEKKVVKEVDITPHTSLLPKLGQTGYRVYESLSEFVDNAIDAKSKGQKLVKITIILEEGLVKITDNSSGMDEDTSVKALTLAHSAKKDKLGQFGLGLKTAATSLGKKFTITTGVPGDPHKYRLIYDEDIWLDSDDWKSQKLEILNKKNPDWHGTIIKIENLKFPYYPNLVTNVKRQLSFQFGPYLHDGQLEIKVNSRYCEPPKIDLVEGKQYEIDITLKNGNKITGWYGFLKVRSVKGHYGFNLFKNGRLIKKEQKIGFEAHPEVATIYGDLNLNFVPTTHNKREFITNSYEYKEVKREIRKFVKKNKITTIARQISKLQTLKKTEGKIKKSLDPFFKFINEIEEIKNPSSFIEIKEITSEISSEEIEGIKKESHAEQFDIETMEEGKDYELTIKGKKYCFEYNLRPLGKERKWMQYTIEGNKINIYLNTEFPLFPFLKDSTTYSLIFVSEAISEQIIREYSLENEKILGIREFILRGLGEVQERHEKLKTISKKKRALEKELEEIQKLENGA